MGLSSLGAPASDLTRLAASGFWDLRVAYEDLVAYCIAYPEHERHGDAVHKRNRPSFLAMLLHSSPIFKPFRCVTRVPNQRALFYRR